MSWENKYNSNSQLSPRATGPANAQSFSDYVLSNSPPYQFNRGVPEYNANVYRAGSMNQPQFPMGQGIVFGNQQQYSPPPFRPNTVFGTQFLLPPEQRAPGGAYLPVSSGTDERAATVNAEDNYSDEDGGGANWNDVPLDFEDSYNAFASPRRQPSRGVNSLQRRPHLPPPPPAPQTQTNYNVPRSGYYTQNGSMGGSGLPDRRIAPTMYNGPSQYGFGGNISPDNDPFRLNPLYQQPPPRPYNPQSRPAYAPTTCSRIGCKCRERLNNYNVAGRTEPTFAQNAPPLASSTRRQSAPRLPRASFEQYVVPSPSPSPPPPSSSSSSSAIPVESNSSWVKSQKRVRNKIVWKEPITTEEMRASRGFSVVGVPQPKMTENELASIREDYSDATRLRAFSKPDPNGQMGDILKRCVRIDDQEMEALQTLRGNYTKNKGSKRIGKEEALNNMRAFGVRRKKKDLLRAQRQVRDEEGDSS